ncbi:unnamed protein product [Owenia fusiformis]|uniref:Uncharacterized protein n=1 Tax=Owenia fusiformis TaxID=6347 RepID=A0A8J1UKG5_OWEFU|nr:unnamed protein product [Owenia fusiformis]
MVLFVDVHHVFKHPIELVAQTHFNKYPTKREPFVERIDTLEQFKEGDLEYRKRVAICTNVVPSFMRKLAILNEPQILLQEEAWQHLKSRKLRLKSCNLTWAKYASMSEQATFREHHSNPDWTIMEQVGSIKINGLGFLGTLIEQFAQSFLNSGVQRGLDIMDEILVEKAEQLQSKTDSVEVAHEDQPHVCHDTPNILKYIFKNYNVKRAKKCNVTVDRQLFDINSQEPLSKTLLNLQKFSEFLTQCLVIE